MAGYIEWELVEWKVPPEAGNSVSLCCHVGIFVYEGLFIGIDESVCVYFDSYISLSIITLFDRILM